MKSLREQIANRCVHFSGIQQEQCAVGIAYATFAGKLPCLKSFGGEQVDCAKRQWPTAAQVEAEVAECDAATENFAKVLPLIAKIKREHRKEAWRGTEPCPICGKTLHLQIAKGNGHVWGQCETKGCLSWME